MFTLHALRILHSGSLLACSQVSHTLTCFLVKAGAPNDSIVYSAVGKQVALPHKHYYYLHNHGHYFMLLTLRNKVMFKSKMSECC